jgi:hypothetical protein
MKSLVQHNITSFAITDGGVARDAGGGLVGIPVVGHDFKAGISVTIANTVNYNGAEVIVSQTRDEIVITAAYSAETFASGDTVIRDAVDSTKQAFIGHTGVASVHFFLNVTALAGSTPLLDMTIEHTVDGITAVLGSFAQASGVTNEAITVANCPENFFVRTNFTNTITDADFKVSAERY